MKQFERTILLIGQEAFEKLQNSHVLVVGAGGVGGFVIEALVRAGIGSLSIIDFDKIDITNINRQVIATHKTVGMQKVEAIAERAREINPNVNIKIYNEKLTKENVEKYFEDINYDYVVDCIDMISSKLALIEFSKNKNIPVISSMGAGNKLQPELFQVADISKTSVCPMARVLRKELKDKKIKGVKAVFSIEIPKKPGLADGERAFSVVSSISFVPSVVGLIIGGEVIKDICQIN